MTNETRPGRLLIETWRLAWLCGTRSATLGALSASRQPSESAQFAVFLSEALPLVGHGALVKDGVHWALGLTSATLDAFIRVDVVHLLGLVNARDWADVHTA